jgi:hypothetical protein
MPAPAAMGNKIGRSTRCGESCVIEADQEFKIVGHNPRLTVMNRRSTQRRQSAMMRGSFGRSAFPPLELG